MDKLILALLLVLSFNVSAEDAAYLNMQRAMGGIIQDQALKRGVSTTDPRTYGTLYGVGKAAAAGAAVGAGTALVVGTAPAWGTVLAVSAVGGAISYGVTVGLDSLVKWAFPGPVSSPTPVLVSQSSTSSPPVVLAPLSSGSSAFTSSNCGGNGGPVWASSVDGVGAACAAVAYAVWGGDPQAPAYSVVSCGAESCVLRRHPSIYSVEPFDFTILVGPGVSPYECASGAWGASGCFSSSPQPMIPAPAYVSNDGAQTLADAISALTAVQRQEKLSHETMALLINLLVNKAAQEPDYAGLPVSLYEPFVTAADVAAWDAAHPGAYPTVDGLVTPVSNSSVDFAPSTVSAPGVAVSPAIQSVPQGSINPTQAAPKVDLGPDPAIGTPTLEATPTASAILAPVLGLMPSLRSFVMPSHSAVCPAPSGDLFGQSFTLDDHCALLEEVRPTLSLVMAAVWLMVSTLVVLRA